MKRIYVFGLFLTMLLGFGFHSKADLTVTLTWDTPGTMAPFAKLKNDIVSVSSTETTQNFTLENTTWGTFYLWPADGYYFVEATTEAGGAITPGTAKPDAGVLDYTPANSIALDMKTYNGQTVHLKIAEIERNDVLTVNVVNGVANINKFLFNQSGYAPKLEKGRNTVKYNAEIDGTTLEIQFAGDGPETAPYQFTFNNEEPFPYTAYAYNDPTYTAYQAATFKETNAVTHYYSCTLDPSAEDNYMYIQVFENDDEEPDTYSVDISYGENMQGALSMIYNRKTSASYYPAAFEGGVINQLTDILPGTELRFTFDSDDYTVTEVLVNGVNMTSSLESDANGIQQSIVITINEDTNITVNGTAIIWSNIKYYGYISNPDWVQFGLAQDATYDLSYSIANSNVGGQTYGVLTMPEGSKEIELTVSEKNNGGRGTFYFKPKEGYFITKCYFGTPADGESGTQTVNAGMGYQNDGNTFYMIVEKLDAPYTANLKVVDTTGYPVTTNIKGSTTYSEQNDNPAQAVVVINHDRLGESEFSFIPNYDNPFNIICNPDQNLRAYLDGAEVVGIPDPTPNTTSGQTWYPLSLYAPAEGETSDIHSDVQVWYTGAPAMSTATMKLENNATAQFYYSPVMHEANPEGQSVITGTYMYVKPTSKNAVVLYKGAVQELDENGLFGFATGSAEDNTVTVTGPKEIKIAGMIPKAGSTVKSLKQVSLRVPMTADDEEINLQVDENILLQTVVILNNAEVATVTEIGEPEMDETTAQLIVPLILSKEITEKGEDYFVKVPEGAFIQKDWDESKEEFVAVPGGYLTAAFSGRFDVDPDMKYPVEIYTLTPADEEAVEEISEVLVSFPEIPSTAMFTGNEFPNATFTCGDETVEAMVMYDWNSAEEYRVVKVTPIDASEEPTAIKTKGEWTMTIAEGTFEYEGNQSPEITATFTVAPKEIAYTLTPAEGTVKTLSTIKIEFAGVKEIVETEESVEVEGETQTVNISANIKLAGPDYDKTPSEVKVVNGGTEQNENAYVELSFTSVLNEGDYTLTIPAYAFTLDGTASAPISATYTYKPDWKLTPTPGSTVASLDEFTLEFPEATEVTFVGTSTSFALSDLTNNEGYGSQNFDCTEVTGAAHPTFTLKNAMIVKPASGNYKFYIDEGAFQIDGEANAEIYAEYTLDVPVSTEYIRIPENETIVNTENLGWGLILGVAFDGGMTIANGDASKVKLTHTDAEGTETEVALDPIQGQIAFGFDDAPGYEGYKSVVVMVIPELGSYTLAIEAGAFTIGGEACQAINETWTVVEDKKFEIETTPSEEGATQDPTSNVTSSLAEISVFIGGASKIDITNPNGATLTGAGYSETGTITVVDAPQVRMRAEGTTSGVEVKVTFENAPTADKSEYTFSMEPGTLKIDDVYDSPSIEKTYTLDTSTGLWLLFADENGNVTVYTLDGKSVMQNKPASSLRELEKGMYIINGKKTLVK